MMREEEIKEHLLSSSPEYRRLVEEHSAFEGRLQAFHSRHTTDQDHLEEIDLKKRKLHLKDQMNAMIQKFRAESMSHQHT